MSVAQRLPPQARVDEVGPLLVEPRLELVLVDRADAAARAPGAPSAGSPRPAPRRCRAPSGRRSGPRCGRRSRRRARMPISAARSIRSTSSSRSPSSATGTPASNSTSTICGSSGASSGRVTSWKTSSSGACERSSIHLPSDERPQRLSSIEYGAALGAALDGDAVLARVGDLLVAAHLPTSAPARSPSARARASRPCPRSAPGRCPCRCSRGRSCRSPSCARTRPRAWRSAAGRAR